MKTSILKIKKLVIQHQSFLISVFVIFLLIMLNMPPNQWHSNEEYYLGTAWRRFSPKEMFEVSALRDAGYHRFVFELAVGFFINQIGFEWTHALGRILVALLYSISLTLFFKQLQFSLVSSLTILLTFIWLDEQILGGEWLFRGFEAKTLAYPLIFFSFTNLLKNQFTLTYLGLSLATYFHFLVGGFWVVIIVVIHYYLTKNFKQVVLTFSKYYILVCLPLFVIIVINQLPNSSKTFESLPSPGLIYTYFRVPHHTAPFASTKIFINQWYGEILFLLGLMISSVILYRHGNREEKDFIKLIFFLNFYLFLGLIVSYFDKNGSLGKFYFFRPSSVILLLNLCLFCFLIGSRVTKAKFLGVVALILISSLTIPRLSGHNIIYKRAESIVLNQQPIYSVIEIVKDFFPSYRELFKLPIKTKYSKLDLVLQASESDDITLISPNLEASYISFERKYNRPTLVSWKFVPSTSQDILRWYQLVKMKKELFNKGCPSQLVEQYKIRYLLSELNNVSVNSCGKEVYRDNKVKLIEVN
jgi:hypothetical protein